MGKRNRWKRISAWILASAMVFGSSPGAAYAESLDDAGAVFESGDAAAEETASDIALFSDDEIETEAAAAEWEENALLADAEDFTADAEAGENAEEDTADAEVGENAGEDSANVEAGESAEEDAADAEAMEDSGI